MKENNVVTSETKDALSFGSLSHTAVSSSHPCDRVSCRWSNIEKSRLLRFAKSRRTCLRQSNIWPGSSGVRLVLRLQTR